MAQSTLISLCWIALGLSAVGAIAGASIGAAYNPENGGRYLAGAVGPVVGIGGLLYFLPRTAGVLWGVLLFATALAGLALVGFFAYRLLIDGGDALLWLPPLILGLGLLGLVFVGGPAKKRRGDG